MACEQVQNVPVYPPAGNIEGEVVLTGGRSLQPVNASFKGVSLTRSIDRFGDQQPSLLPEIFALPLQPAALS